MNALKRTTLRAATVIVGSAWMTLTAASVAADHIPVGTPAYRVIVKTKPGEFLYRLGQILDGRDIQGHRPWAERPPQV